MADARCRSCAKVGAWQTLELQLLSMLRHDQTSGRRHPRGPSIAVRVSRLLNVAERPVFGVLPMVLASALGLAACSEPPAAAPPREAPSSIVPASETGLTSVTGKAPRGTFIVLEPAVPREFPVPESPVVMDQLGKQFIPGLLVARAGQPVEFRNSEDTPHNVYVKRSRTGREVLNVSTDPLQKHVHVFEEPGQYEVSCDIHPGMFAMIAVVATPYAAVADERGNFLILNVIPGAYTMTASSGARDVVRSVDITGPHTDIGSAGF
jgi:plastocyanin